MIDLRQLMDERSAHPPAAVDLRYPQIRRRIAARNRRRAGLAAAALAVALAIAGGYAALPRVHVTPGPLATISPGPTPNLFPQFMSGNRLAHSTTAPVADRTVSLSWTPSTLDFTIVLRCVGVPNRATILGQMVANGMPFGNSSCDIPTYYHMSDQAFRGDLVIPVGEPITVSYNIVAATASNDPQRQVPIPTEGTIALGIYAPVPFADYPLPSRPARLGPLSSWRNCPPEQHAQADARTPLAPVTLTTLWRDQILIRYQVLTPGLLHVAVDGVAVTTLKWWEYDNPSATIVWDTTRPDEWAKVSGWKAVPQGKPVTITFTPEHLTGEWQVGVEHSVFTDCR